jgi:glucose dehydrogenase
MRFRSSYDKHLPLCVVIAVSLLLIVGLRMQYAHPKENTAGEWRNYGADKASSKYSPLAQINKDNFKSLKIAWTWRSADEEIIKANSHLKTWVWESTPLMVGGILFVSTSLSQVAAIDAATGKTQWVYDPEAWKGATPPNHGFVHRGVAYWADGKDQRILFGTGDGYLICLNAQTGKPVSTFGQEGRIVRGFDVRTGKQRWLFRSVPGQEEFGKETWEQDSWKTTGNTNVWTMMSADAELGYVYLPFGTPTNDYYGGQRPGNGLFGESLVCLDARNGKRIWHFQMVRHGVWDYDLPAPPNLIDINVNGRPIKAVAQVSKHGFCYVFDRVTGAPIWPIEEKPVPQSTVPGEKLSPTQPFPTKPAPYDRQGMTKDDVVDFTPELRKSALAILEKYNYGPLFTPPSLQKPTILMPGVAGGASWAGAAADPETGMLYVPSITLPLAVTMAKSPLPHADYIAEPGPVETAQGLPIWKPPYGRVTAINLNTGDHRWMAPLGDIARNNTVLKPLNLPPVGRPARGHTLLTKTLLIVGQEGNTQRVNARGLAIVADFEIHDPKLSAHDKATARWLGK